MGRSVIGHRAPPGRPQTRLPNSNHPVELTLLSAVGSGLPTARPHCSLVRDRVVAVRALGFPNTRYPSGRRRLFTAGRPAAASQSHTGLAEHPVHESVGTAGFFGQRPDTRTGVVLLLQVCRELIA